MDLDLSNYKKLKEKQAIAVGAVGEAIFLVMPRFDPNTGIKLDPQTVPISKKQVEQVIEDLRARLAAIEELLADMTALEGGS